MERKVQRVEGVTGVRIRPGQAPRVIARRFGSGAGASGAAWYGAERGCGQGADGEGSIMNRDMRGTTGCRARIDAAANNLPLLATISLVFLYKILYVPRWIPPPIVRDLELH